MRQAEWLAGDNPVALLTFLQGKGRASARKLRLFACACCRRLWRLLPEKRRRAVEASDRFADRQIGEKERAAHDDANVIGRPSAEYAAYYASLPTRSLRGVVYNVAHCAALAVSEVADGSGSGDARKAERSAQVDLIRCVFGPPVRPASSAARWRTRETQALAMAAYEDRDLPEGTLNAARLAILADALEEAGCGDAELLAHLRSPGPHVRGCWPVDGLLGKR